LIGERHVPPRKVASIVALLTVGSIAAGCGVEHVPTSDPLPAPLILDPPETAWFDLRLMRKDIALALNAGQPLGMALPVTGCAGGGTRRGGILRIWAPGHRVAGGGGGTDGALTLLAIVRAGIGQVRRQWLRRRVPQWRRSIGERGWGVAEAELEAQAVHEVGLGEPHEAGALRAGVDADPVAGVDEAAQLPVDAHDYLARAFEDAYPEPLATR